MLPTAPCAHCDHTDRVLRFADTSEDSANRRLVRATHVRHAPSLAHRASAVTEELTKRLDAAKSAA